MSRWALLQLVHYLAELNPATPVAASVTVDDLARSGVERAVEIVGVDFGALVVRGAVEATAGLSVPTPSAAHVAAAVDGGPLQVPGLGSWHSVAAPLDGGARHLVLARPHPPFGYDEATLVQALAGVLAISLHNAESLTVEREMRARSEQQAADALLDPLTGLSNRALFLDRFHHALAASSRTGHLVAVLFMDVDRFKLVNDSLGHAAGDLLLVRLADRSPTACGRSSGRTTRWPVSGATSSRC